MLGEDRELTRDIHIDFVPMADVLFNMLIFFLLATTVAQVEREMNIALPFASSGGPISTMLQELVINVDAEGKIWVGGRTFAAEELRNMVGEAVKRKSDQKVTIRGDRSASYANIVQVLDICKQGGIQQPYLDTVLGN